MSVIALFAAALLSQAGECPVIVARAESAYQSRRFDQAIGEFEAALRVCPKREPLLLSIGQSQLMAQRFADAVRTFDSLLSLEPSNVNALKLKADALYLAGREIEAEKALVGARTLDAHNEGVLYALARMYYQQNRYSEAVPIYLDILARQPSNFRAHDNLALCYEALNQDDLALKHYFTALKLVYKDHPEYDWVYGNLANFYLRRDENEKAFQTGAEAAKRNPERARNFFLTGKALQRLGKNPESIRWLEQAVKLDPKYPEPRYLLSQAYRKAGRKADADRQLEEFRVLNEAPRPKR